ncbi:lipid-A-disaccharide synthase N-terminal domain-containing protein [Halomonas sp. M20]|uniref:lipid-A-disaccharide synthase N-terminal domain-containing protein n=1 Tax=Halomonas sp. M20 TaxID=2763264 RepID=UPI001D0AAB42|nr:lipid-A-disaccharide synthase N-terminal domain-containing protein [Halomonas sp. M20]
MNSEWLWLSIGFLGQALFSARFIVQWLASERARRSIVPKAFWFLSLGGGATLLAYALYRRDPVFIAGQGAGLFIYARNLMLIRRESREVRYEKNAAPPSP